MDRNDLAARVTEVEKENDSLSTEVVPINEVSEKEYTAPRRGSIYHEG